MSQTALLKRGLLLEYLTLGWNVVGVITVILAAYAAHSVALAGFDLDSLIEIFASVVVLWQLTGINLKRERPALRFISIAFIALVMYIVAQLLITLLTGTHPASSVGGSFGSRPRSLPCFCSLRVRASPGKNYRMKSC